MDKKITYCAPSPKLIDACAHRICTDLSEKLREPYNASAVEWGLAEYLKVVATIAVKAANKDHESASVDGLSESVDN